MELNWTNLRKRSSILEILSQQWVPNEEKIVLDQWKDKNRKQYKEVQKKWLTVGKNLEAKQSDG